MFLNMVPTHVKGIYLDENKFFFLKTHKDIHEQKSKTNENVTNPVNNTKYDESCKQY